MSPAGVVHYSWYKRFMIVWIIFCVAMLFTLSRIDFVVTLLLGYLLGYFIDPDLDQIGITSAEGRMLHHFGCLGSIFVAYWLPYSFVMPHRSFLSHFPFVSTAIRLLYLLLIPTGIGTYIYITYPIYKEWVFLSIFWMIGLWIGLSVADSVHYILDEVY